MRTWKKQREFKKRPTSVSCEIEFIFEFCSNFIIIIAMNNPNAGRFAHLQRKMYWQIRKSTKTAAEKRFDVGSDN